MGIISKETKTWPSFPGVDDGIGQVYWPDFASGFISSSLLDPGLHYHVGFGLAASPWSPHLTSFNGLFGAPSF